MFRRLSNSWKLVKASAAVLRADKELVIFPIISTIGVTIVTITFFVPMIMAGFLDSFFAGGARILGYIVLFFFYLVQYFVIFFANSALVGAAMIRIKGGDPTLGDGFRIAAQRFGSLLGYAAIAATVGLVLQIIADRAGGFGRIVTGILGFGWNLATFLVVPILVVEDVGPVDAIKRSAGLLKQTWGEQIAGNFSIGVIFLLFYMIAFFAGIPLIAMVAFTGNIVLIAGVVLLFILLLVVLAVTSSTLSGIYRAAVYQYAVTGEAGDFFAPELVEGAFRQK